MDNPGSHRGKAVRRAIRKAWPKLLFLPEYSPALNAFQQVFSKPKHMLRKTRARSYDAMLECIGACVKTYSFQECGNYLHNCRYGAV
jgi:transposase